jgi:hypothetical protein
MGVFGINEFLGLDTGIFIDVRGLNAQLIGPPMGIGIKAVIILRNSLDYLPWLLGGGPIVKIYQGIISHWLA